MCYAPSRLGKLVLRITGFPRVTHQCHQSQQQEDSHHRETRHLYLGFHHPWDRDLWKSWIKQVSQTQGSSLSLSLSPLLPSKLSTMTMLLDFPFLHFFFYYFSTSFLFFVTFFAVNGKEKLGREDRNKNILFEILFYIVNRDELWNSWYDSIARNNHFLLLTNNIRCAIF